MILYPFQRGKRLYFASNTCSIYFFFFFLRARKYIYFFYLFYIIFIYPLIYHYFRFLGTFLDGYRMPFFFNYRISFFGISGFTIKNCGQLQTKIEKERLKITLKIITAVIFVLSKSAHKFFAG